MISDVARIFKELDKKDFRILNGIELGMRTHEWVPVEYLLSFTGFSYGDLEYKLRKLLYYKLVISTHMPYDGYRIYFEGYDALALNAFVKRNVICAIGDEIGVGKESVVHEAIREPELAIGDYEPVIVKFHREGQTSFKSVKRARGHLEGKEHFSWIYAARLAAQREYEIMKKLYPKVSIPTPIDCNRHAIVMEVAKGSILAKTKLGDPAHFLNEILLQISNAYEEDVIHSDLSEYNIFVSTEGVQLIDWPQYVTLVHPHAKDLLLRDISNILNHFEKKYDIHMDAAAVYNDITSGKKIRV
ncbi:RIO1 family regulatory kinase/ATPase [Methanohalophilus sp.]|uniref:serine/threonine-protein kinase RIO2 n=1 Tax=Methanohalophilus sp. TaxID=1966352 RepID=UPI002633BBB2|nr:RIO1 family regulatory kinase/ATPase [Methanohalophilus sp.]MDK2892052.1 kinase 2 [Methanohalophilus sp.]